MSSNWSPPSSYGTRPVVVLGGGVLGRRIACCWASAGYAVNIRDPSSQQRDGALDYIKENINDFTKSTGRTPGKVNTYTDLDAAVKDAWLVLEAVPEDLQLKIDTFAELETLAPHDCILASNSSSYKSCELLTKIKHDDTKERILNVHYMMPPQIRIVELMTDGTTHPGIFDFLVERLKETALVPHVALVESTGFIFNRLWAAIKRESLSILSEGVTTPESLDQLFSTMFGSPYGPCQMMDYVGLDTVASIEKQYVRERNLPAKHTIDYLEENFLKRGKLGTKCNKGGLYPSQQQLASGPPEPRIIVLDVGLSQPLLGRDIKSILTSGKIIEVTDDGKSARTLANNLGLPDGIDICNSNQRLYWSDMGTPPLNDGRVLSCNLDGSDMQTIIPRGSISTPKQIIVEQTSNKLYVSDREGLRVFRCDIDGSNLEVIIQAGDHENSDDKNDITKHCVGIAVSANLGKFFWTQKGPSKGGKGRIFSANIGMPEGQSAIDRKDIRTLLDDLPEPIDLEIDEAAGILYWTDRGEVPFGNTLNKIQLDGSGNPVFAKSGILKYEIVAQGFHEAIGLRLDSQNGFMYVSDMGGAVWKCGLDGKKKERIYEDQDAAFTGLLLVK